MDSLKKLAEEIVGVLHHNKDLSNDNKVLAVSLRLKELAKTVADKTEKRIREQKISVSDYSQILPSELLKKNVVFN